MIDEAAAGNSWLAEVNRVAAMIRRRGLELAVEHSGGYVIQACSSADILATLYVRLMKLGAPPADTLPAPFRGTPRSGAPDQWGGAFNGDDAPENDRFILSPSHYSTAVYAALIETGRLSSGALATYNSDGTTLEMIGAEHSPGIEVTGGSLGQALSVGVGRALWRRRCGHSGLIWVLISDGETQEGQTWEAFQAAAAFGLDNLRVLIDVNGWQVDGPMDEVMPVGSLTAKVAAFGCEAREVDGHDPVAIASAATLDGGGRPIVVVCRTDPARGFPAIAGRDNSMTHFIRFRPGEAEEFRASSPLYEDVPR